MHDLTDIVLEAAHLIHSNTFPPFTSLEDWLKRKIRNKESIEEAAKSVVEIVNELNKGADLGSTE